MNLIIVDFAWFDADGDHLVRSVGILEKHARPVAGLLHGITRYDDGVAVVSERQGDGRIHSGVQSWALFGGRFKDRFGPVFGDFDTV